MKRSDYNKLVRRFGEHVHVTRQSPPAIRKLAAKQSARQAHV